MSHEADEAQTSSEISLRFQPEDRVLANFSKSYRRGCIVKTNVECNGKRYVYEIKLDSGETIYAPNDTESCVQKELFRSVRFSIGRRVIARVAGGEWRSGRVVSANVVLEGVQVAYLIDLDIGTSVTAPNDDNEIVREEPVDVDGEIVRPNLRFSIGDSVWINVGQNQMKMAKVTKQWVFSKQTKQEYVYEVMTEDGFERRVMNVPLDSDACIRIRERASLPRFVTGTPVSLTTGPQSEKLYGLINRVAILDEKGKLHPYELKLRRENNYYLCLVPTDSPEVVSRVEITDLTPDKLVQMYKPIVHSEVRFILGSEVMVRVQEDEFAFGTVKSCNTGSENPRYVVKIQDGENSIDIWVDHEYFITSRPKHLTLPRFAKGEDVWIKTSTGWSPGTVERYWFQCNGQICPYQVKTGDSSFGVPEDNEDFICKSRPVLRFKVGDLAWCHAKGGGCVPIEITDLWWRDPESNTEACYRAKLPDGRFIPILSDSLEVLSLRVCSTTLRFDSKMIVRIDVNGTPTVGVISRCHVMIDSFVHAYEVIYRNELASIIVLLSEDTEQGISEVTNISEDERQRLLALLDIDRRKHSRNIGKRKKFRFGENDLVWVHSSMRGNDCVIPAVVSQTNVFGMDYELKTMDGSVMYVREDLEALIKRRNQRVQVLRFKLDDPVMIMVAEVGWVPGFVECGWSMSENEIFAYMVRTLKGHKIFRVPGDHDNIIRATPTEDRSAIVKEGAGVIDLKSLELID